MAFFGRVWRQQGQLKMGFGQARVWGFGVSGPKASCSERFGVVELYDQFEFDFRIGFGSRGPGLSLARNESILLHFPKLIKFSLLACPNSHFRVLQSFWKCTSSLFEPKLVQNSLNFKIIIFQWWRVRVAKSQNWLFKVLAHQNGPFIRENPKSALLWHFFGFFFNFDPKIRLVGPNLA